MSKVTVEGTNFTITDDQGQVVYSTTPPVIPPVDPPPPSTGLVIKVGPTRGIKAMSAGVAVASSGDTIELDSGVYTDDFATITKKLTIRGVNGKATLNAAVSPPNGKAILVVQADLVVENLIFTGVKVQSLNGAGIRVEKGKLSVDQCLFRDNQMGILSNPDPSGVITIKNTEFDHNGAAGSNAHNCYIGVIAEVIVDNIYSHDNTTGHQFKSRAKKTTITNSLFYDHNGGGGYNIDIPEGGATVIKNCTIQQKVSAGNTTMINYGEEVAPGPDSSLAVSNNVFINDHTSGVAVRTTFPATFIDNATWGPANLVGPVTAQGTVVLPARPI